MYRIGIDIGGTSVKIGLVDQELNILHRHSIPFRPIGGEGVAAAIAEAVRQLLADHGIKESELESLGFVVPGSIDPTGSVVVDAYNLEFHHVPLKALMQVHFPDLPVFMANDADGAALAELGRGAFVGRQSAVLLTLGTGVGGGLILGGQMYCGGMGHGVEIGHLVLEHGGYPCTCGISGCFEALASATALIRYGTEAAQADPKGLIAGKVGGDLSAIDAKLVIDCAKEGDKGAMAAFERYLDYLSTGCASIVNLLDPEVIAIGGGVSHAGDFLFEPLNRLTLEKCFFDECCQVVPAVMGNDAGIIGAAMLR